jgi:antitoxin FitA
MTITLKNIPPRLHRELKRRAEMNRRSLNSEVLSCLEKTTFSQPVDRNASNALLEDIRKMRSKFNFYITEADLEKDKKWGRA